jgi:hypothetical protein
MSEESGHYYLRDGTPCHEVPAKSKGPGGMRAFNLRWDRHLGASASVTTQLKIIAAPPLEKWKRKQVVLSALTIPRIDGETDDELFERIERDGAAQAKAAADEGSRVHHASHMNRLGKPFDAKYIPHVNALAAEVKRLFPDVNDWVPEKSFCHRSGFGGSVDLHSPSIGIIIDYKGKDGDFTEVDIYGEPKKLNWDQHWQLGGYRKGLELPRAPCANIFFSRTHPGLVKSHVWMPEEIDEGQEIFECAVALYKRLKKYDPSW